MASIQNNENSQESISDNLSNQSESFSELSQEVNMNTSTHSASVNSDGPVPEEVLFPADYNENYPPPPQEDQPQTQLTQSQARSNDYFDYLLEDQQDFLRSLETAENQMMFDEDFMILVSKIANKNSDKMFRKDFRDETLDGDIDSWLN